ncbi:TPA: hypothetical protein U2B88_000869 [Streptococcus suis]|uniref:CpsT n=1 Tax=Streptococcus suis TaxID=1307 RepID=A0A1P8VRT4_STRSU|nr:cpsT [Streptococcus suis]HEM5210169.1 hypothetical protein [Streptococcus suis]HEM6088857.1 hypothetical protein [Streptococcus suis]
MTFNYLIDNFTLSSSPASFRQEVERIARIVKEDFYCYKITNSFFLVLTDNTSVPKTAAEAKLDEFKEEFEIYEDAEVSSDLYSSLKVILLDFFENPNINKVTYRAIYSSYLEYLVKMWQSIPGVDGQVEIEPEIRYNGSLMFSDKDFHRSKCDIVYLNKFSKELKLYECKFRLFSFMSDLNYNGTVSKILKKQAKVKRKIAYMKAFHGIFEAGEVDAEQAEIAFVTLAHKSQIQQDIVHLSPLKIYTREDIETREVFSTFYV